MRVVAAMARPGDAAGCPPGVPRERFGAALLADVCDAVARLAGVRAAVVLSPPGWLPAAELPIWPDTLVLDAPDGPDQLAAALAALTAAGAEQAAIVAGDAPDLPGLLIGKLFRALGTAEVAVCPAAGGGLVALAARLPVVDWAHAAGLSLDTSETPARLAAAAPHRRALGIGPGWHRLRTAADLGRLDRGLEGWEATRALLYP